MRCHVCGHEVKTGYSKCQCCDFPMLIHLEQNEESNESFRAAVIKYRREKQKAMEIGILAFSWERDGNTLKKAGESRILIAVCEQLQDGTVCWLDSDMFYLGEKPLTIHYYIHTPDGQESVRTVSLENPGLQEAKVGVSMDAEGYIHFHLGQEGQSAVSENINAFRKRDAAETEGEERKNDSKSI